MSELDSTHHDQEEGVITLFRPEVMAARNRRWMGEVLQISPLPLKFIAISCALFVLAFVFFLFLAKFTKYTRVTGILEPDTGLVTVQSPLQGIVVAKSVKEGQRVRAGDVLYRISTDISVAGATPANAEGGESPGEKLQESGTAVLASIDRQSDTFRKQKTELTDLLSSQKNQLAHSIESLTLQLANVDAQLKNQKDRLNSAQKIYERYQTLVSQGYISDLGLEQKHDDLFEQTAKFQSLQDNRILLEKDIQAAEDNLRLAEVQSAQEATKLERSELELKAAAIKGQAARQILITAPQDGVVSTVMMEPGQLVKNQTLLTIIPANSSLEAHLFIKAKDIGFIEDGQEVHVRYQAFPFERFGQFKGTVSGISQTSIPPQDIPQTFANSKDVSEGVYRVKVKLTDQSILARGKSLPLVSGMQLDAEIVQDSKTIMDWLFDPIRASMR